MVVRLGNAVKMDSSIGELLERVTFDVRELFRPIFHESELFIRGSSVWRHIDREPPAISNSNPVTSLSSLPE